MLSYNNAAASNKEDEGEWGILGTQSWSVNVCWSRKSLHYQDAEEDGDDEEVSPREGGCDVHPAAALPLLSAALRPSGQNANGR